VGQPQRLGGQALESRLPVAPFLVRKLTGQARRFTTLFLEGALRRLLEMDVEIKTGKIDAALALDLFVAEVCAGRR
jgi:DNA polymerase III delta subunit